MDEIEEKSRVTKLTVHHYMCPYRLHKLGIIAGIKTEALLTNFILAFFIDKLGRRPVYM